MKILFCTNAFDKVSNGPAKFAHLLLNNAEAGGLEVQILTENVTDTQPNVHKLELKIPSFLNFFSQFIRMWKYYRTSMAIREHFPFDVVVYNNALVGLISCLLFKPTVGMINDYTNADHSINSLFKGRVMLNKRIIFHYVELLTCKLMKNIIVNSYFLKTRLSNSYSCDESKFKVLHKGIEDHLVRADRKQLVKGKEKNTVLFVKTDFILGGLHTLIDAIKLLDKKIKLVIVGPHEVYHEKLEKLLRGGEVEYEIFTYLPPDEVKAKMARAEVFCVPSYREAYGVANLEALALGCKVITTNIGGIPEAVGGDKFAKLVNPGNVTEVCNALKEAFGSSFNNISEGFLDEHLNSCSSFVVISHFKRIVQECF